MANEQEEGLSAEGELNQKERQAAAVSTHPAGRPAVEQLVSDTYAAALDPLHYDQLLDTWQAYLTAGSPRDFIASTSRIKLIHRQVETHFSQAFEILEQVGTRSKETNTEQEFLEHIPSPAIVLNASGCVVAKNSLTSSLAVPLGPDRQLDLKSLLGDEGAESDVRAWLRSGGEHFASLSARMTHQSNRQTYILIGHKLTIGSRSSKTKQDRHLLIFVSPQLTNELRTQLTDMFSLTSAETDIVSALASGVTLQWIADTRGTSVDTVRSQLKSIFRKTGTSGQSDLVRLILSFCFTHALVDHADFPKTDVLSTPKDHAVERTFQLSDGRCLSYFELGDPSGTPVLFFHGILSGPRLSSKIAEHARDRGLRIIAPSRPGYGGSDRLRMDSVDWVCKRLNEDVNELLACLKVEHAVIAGHMMGAVYAFQFAAFRPELTRAIISVSGAIPIVEARQIRSLPPRQRVIAYTALHTPKLLPFLVRAGISQIKAGHEDRFLYALYKSSPADLDALRDPLIRQVALEGVHHAVSAGPHGFCMDSQVLLAQWPNSPSEVRCPVRIFHSPDDTVVSIEDVKSFAATHDFPVTEAEGGQFMLHRSDVLLEAVAEFV